MAERFKIQSSRTLLVRLSEINASVYGMSSELERAMRPEFKTLFRSIRHDWHSSASGISASQPEAAGMILRSLASAVAGEPTQVRASTSELLSEEQPKPDI